MASLNCLLGRHRYVTDHFVPAVENRGAVTYFDGYDHKLLGYDYQQCKRCGDRQVEARYERVLSSAARWKERMP